MKKISYIIAFSILILFLTGCSSRKEPPRDDIIEFGVMKFNDPFIWIDNPGKFLVESLNYSPFKYSKPDTLPIEKEISIEVNEEFIRGNAKTKLLFADKNGNPIKEIEFFVKGQPMDEYTFLADKNWNELTIKAKILPHQRDSLFEGVAFYRIARCRQYQRQ